MATKAKKPAPKSRATATKVTRITAKDETAATPVKKATVVEKQQATTAPTQKSFLQKLATPFVRIGGYFAGSWYELRQVTWTDRKATWSLTLAMLIFTGFFTALILLLDALFKYLFQLILG